ncbi:MAG: hypothetical protein KDA27_14150 [Candidatus Eisenbacteria bacterium]|uniref:Uncharacterized protein n=1 Tax=Eiseniibacteriota bacterium TaxID=2212470 RepID=A0A956NDC8_UNCEI|nr:hypothetical protein [Candidatus Eisenbacteria bacterium]
MARSDRDGPRARFRSRVIGFMLVPVLVLGVSYFLLVEYVAVNSDDLVIGTSLVGLRLGGALLILLAVVLAIAAGYLLADRIVRPIRLLRHYAESGELPSGAGLFVHHRDWEIFLLYRRIHALIQQNRSGAEALAELEELRGSFDELRGRLAKTGQNGVLAPVGRIEGPCLDVSDLLESHRARLLDFFRELRTRTADVRTQFEALEVAYRVAEPVTASPNGSAASSAAEAGGRAAMPESVGPSELVDPGGEALLCLGAELESLATELRRLGTVISLEAELARRATGDAGRLYDEFRLAIGRLEEIAAGCAIVEHDPEFETAAGDGEDGSRETTGATVRDARTVADGPAEADIIAAWQRLREDLGSLERRLEEVEER